MKRNLFRTFVALVAAFGLTSCLADLNDRMDVLEGEMDSLVKNVSDIEALVKAQVYVKEVRETAAGFEMLLSNGESFSLKNGIDGAQGEPGVSVIDGIAGIKSVVIENDYVIFNLEDGGRLALPRNPRVINLEFTGCEVGVYSGVATFKVTDALDPYVVVYGDSDMNFVVSDIKDGVGTVAFEAGERTSVNIVATVIDNASAGANTNSKVLKVNFETRAFNTVLDSATMPAAGGDLQFSFSTNVDYTLEFPEWISQAQTKAMTEYKVNVSVSANDGDYARTGAIKVIDSRKGDCFGTLTVSQRGKFNNLYLLNEGGFGSNNASLTKIDPATWTVTNSWFSTVNSTPLGDVGNDIALTDDYLIIVVNGSNIIQICDRDGKAIAQTEGVANCRKVAVDPSQKYAYVTSYAEDGYVAKIDLTSFNVVATCKTGYEPEGIVIYDGKLFVANSGGYAYLGSHGYEQSISVIDAETMKEIKKVDTGLINLYGAFVQNDRYPRYVLVNSSGDYYMTPAASFIFDCETQEVVDYLEGPSTYATTYAGKFYTVGSEFSYVTYGYTYYLNTIDMSSGTPAVTQGIISESVSDAIKAQVAPYGIFIAPDGEVFITDAGNYVNRGHLSRFNAAGQFQSKEQVGVCPAHFAAD